MRTLVKRKLWITMVLVASATAFFSSCNDDDENTGNSYVNRWIYDNMEFWYYWNTQLPTNPNRSLEPSDFFASLLSSQDRFSWIQDDFEELLKSLQGITREAGYEYKLYLKQGTTDVFMQVMYVKPGSPAESAGLLRGDILEKVNGIQLNINNYQSVLSQLSESHNVSYKRYNGTSFVELGTLSLSTVEYTENPNFYHAIYEVEGKKIGYYVYTFFATGPTNKSTQYNNEMNQVFAEFQASGVTELIVDLRFNSGGSEAATVNLASLIAKGITATDVFAKREYNDLVEEAIINDPQLGSAFLLSRFKALPENIGSQLSRVYVLTSSRTASASELLINGLRPFMEVKLVGDTTLGKAYGSVTLTDEDNPSNKWGMQPIVVKSYNSLDQSNYDNGFYPDIVDQDNDLVLLPIGDVNERLLNIALEDIVGGPVGGRLAYPPLDAGKALAVPTISQKRSMYLEGVERLNRLKKLTLSKQP